MTIKVLGTGCPKCKTLYQKVEQVIASAGMAATLEKVEKIEDIMAYGVMMTPSLVINGKVLTSGRVPSDTEITSWMTAATAEAQTP